jgi:putative toxin-antitoxin system antitoxin component (TIGR02293 family)
MTAGAVAERLGGEKVLEKDVRSDLDLVEMIHEGLPIRAVEVVLERRLLEPSELYALVVPRRTLAHRKERQGTLSPDQSDRLARVVRMLTRAEEALGSAEKAGRWMRKENRALGGRRPLDLLESDIGSRMVERILGRIEHGISS